MEALCTDAEQPRRADLRRTWAPAAPPSASLDRITRLAAALLEAPLAVLSLTRQDRQWTAAGHGLAAGELEDAAAFCARAAAAETILTVEDACADARLAQHPLVSGPRRLRFAAGVPLRSADGLLLGTLCVLDVRPRRLEPAECAHLADLAALLVEQIEQAPAAAPHDEAAEPYRLLAEHLPVVAALHAPDGRLTYVSPACLPLTGDAPEALIGTDPFSAEAERVHPDDRPLVAGARAAARRGEAARTCFRMRHRAGHYVWVEMAACSLRAAETGAPRAFVTVLHDATAHRHREEALVQACEEAEEVGRRRQAFLASISHEIRTSLAALIGFADMISTEIPEPRQEMVALFRKDGYRLVDTLNSVLDLARLDRKGHQLNPTVFDLAEKVREIAAYYELQARERGLHLVADLPEGPVPVLLDAAAVDRVLKNLLSNALKFTPHGRVRVRLRTKGSDVVLAVQDTGIGISRDFLPHVFDEFRQEPHELAHRHGGSGLGLAIVRELVELMNGRIDARSEKGAGSTFTVLLRGAAQGLPPSVREAPQEAPVLAGAAPALPRVLVVEDNPAMQLLLKHLLAETHEAVLASDADEALRLAAQEDFGLVLLDINLGEGKSGEQVLQELRQWPAYTRAQIVAVTAYVLPGDREHFLEVGFDGYLSKPFTKQQLRKMLEMASHAKPQHSSVGRGSLEALLKRCLAGGVIDGYAWEREHITLVRDIASFRLNAQAARSVLTALLNEPA